MKIVFIQHSSFPAFGPMYLSAMLRKAGHRTELLLASEEKAPARAAMRARPDLVAIPVVTGEHRWAEKLVAELTAAGLPTVLGGPHPTFYPDDAARLGSALGIRGEAEGALLDLAAAGGDRMRLPQTPNLIIVDDGNVLINEARPLIENLDELPFPDRELYYRYPFFARASSKQVLTGRGCPFACAFCANHLLHEIYRGKGTWVRRHSPDYVIDEIRVLRDRYGFRTLTFTDDTFVLDRAWLAEFLPRFRREIGVRFLCNVRADLVDADLMAMLVDGGAYGVGMGIESASARLREQVLKKGISNEQIETAAAMVKHAGLLLKTYNILNIPGETFADGLATMELNARLGSDHPAASLLQPYPHYAVTEYAKQQGLLPASFNGNALSGSIYEDSPIRNSDRERLHNLQALFFLGARFPRLQPLVKKLASAARPNRIFTLLSRLLYGFYAARAHRLTPGDIIRLIRHIDVFKI